MHTRVDEKSLLLSEDNDKLLIKKIDDCLALLNNKKNITRLRLGISIPASLLLLAAAAATFSYVWDVKAGKSRRIHGDMDAAEWRWRHEKLNRTYTGRYGDPLERCGDSLSNDISDFCWYPLYRDPSGNYGTPDETAFWRACIPLLNLFCDLVDELTNTKDRLNTALAFCFSGGFAVILVGIMLILKICQQSKNAINKLLSPEELKTLKELCAELNIPFHESQNMNSVVASLNEFRDQLLHPPAYEAYLMSPDQPDAAEPIKISSLIMFNLFGRVPKNKNNAPVNLPAPELKIGGVNI